MQMSREMLLECLVESPRTWGNAIIICDWTFKDGQYIHGLHDPITIDDWNRAKIVPNTKVRILSEEHEAYVRKMALEAGYLIPHDYATDTKPWLSYPFMFFEDLGHQFMYSRKEWAFNDSPEKEIFIEMPYQSLETAMDRAAKTIKSEMENINAKVLAEKVGSKHSHYFQDVSELGEVDVYRVCDLFEVNDASGAKQHAIKKLLCSGKRGAKDERKDLEEARDTINRKLAMMAEDGE